MLLLNLQSCQKILFRELKVLLFYMLTGGGAAKDVTYTDVEEAVLEMLSPTAYVGLPIPESESAPLSK